jgi:hypothetical protein
LTRAYVNDADGSIIVCDVSREGSLDAIRNWKNELDDWIDRSTNDQRKCIPTILFANKSDLLETVSDGFKIGGIVERICNEVNILDWKVRINTIMDMKTLAFRT